MDSVTHLLCGIMNKTSTVIANEQHVSREVLDFENGRWILKHNSGSSHGAELVSTHLGMGDGAKLGAGINHSLMTGGQVHGDDLNRMAHA